MKKFSDPSVTVILFDDNTVFLSGDAFDSSSSRVPTKPISDGGGYDW